MRPDQPIKIYLAGPFFNEAQVAHISKVEAMLEKMPKFEVFSPRKQHEGEDVSINDPQHARDVFEENRMSIERADLVVALLDYLLPKSSFLSVVPGIHSYQLDQVASFPELRIPDAGTVWEMGMAYAHKVPTVGFFSNQPKKANLMLARCCIGFAFSYEALEVGLRALQWNSRSMSWFDKFTQ